MRRKYAARTLIVCGDVTDAKDNHSCELVNSIVDALASFAREGCEVIVLQGNHDYLLLGHPFFAFLNQIEGMRFISTPRRVGEWVFLPHSRLLPLPGLQLIDHNTTHCFMHQTVHGALASNGQRMEGELKARQLPMLHSCTYYSGDIHVPQVCGAVHYIGSPYPVHFGDSYNPRVLVLTDAGGKAKEHHWQGLRRVVAQVGSAEELRGSGAREGDQLKVRLALSRQDMPEWHERKREVQAWCDRRGVRLMSVELLRPATRKQIRDDDTKAPLVDRVDAAPLSVLHRYVKDRGLAPQVADAGREIVRKQGGGR